MLALVVLLRALLCPAALLAAAAAETSGYAATPFAGRLPLLFPGVLVVQVLQCFPGLLLLLLLLHLTQNPLRQQRTSRCAVCRKNESTERGARSSAISGLTRPFRLTKSSAFGPSGLELDLGSRKGGPRTSKRRAAFCTLLSEHSEKRGGSPSPLRLGLSARSPLPWQGRVCPVLPRASAARGG